MHYRIMETWRLAAAIAIMIYHFLRFGPPEAIEAGVFLHRFLPLMEMFFMISGYLIMERYGDSLMRGDQSFSKYLLRRIARIYPLYLVTLGFFVAQCRREGAKRRLLVWVVTVTKLCQPSMRVQVPIGPFVQEQGLCPARRATHSATAENSQGQAAHPRHLSTGVCYWVGAVPLARRSESSASSSRF